MRIDTLSERIANAKAMIEKKQNTIIKKEKMIEKKTTEIIKLGGTPEMTVQEARAISNDAMWFVSDIEYLKKDIVRLGKEIVEKTKSLENYELQLAGEMEREAILVREIPESMKKMQTELIEVWDRFDIARRDQMKRDRYEMPRQDFCKKYSVTDRTDFIYKTDEQIHRSNENDARVMIIDLYNRVKAITGEVTDWSGIRYSAGNNFNAVLNGIVIGKEGRARVESILAGGYNIQRLHIRVLVHSF